MKLKLFYQPAERLRMAVTGREGQDGGDRSYVTVRPAWAAPLSRPGKFLALLDEKGEEIVMLEEPERELDEPSWQAVQEELRRRYLTATVEAIRGAKEEFGVTYWSVETDRGARDFVMTSLHENALWFSGTHLLLIDVDGNRFEILETQKLDARSRGFLELIL